MMGKRKRYSAEFKAKVALEALRGELTVSQLATKYGVHQTMIGDWKRQAMEGLVSVFSGKTEAREGIREEKLEKLHAKIGQLVVERDFCSPPAGYPRPPGRRGWNRASTAARCLRRSRRSAEHSQPLGLKPSHQVCRCAPPPPCIGYPPTLNLPDDTHRP